VKSLTEEEKRQPCKCGHQRGLHSHDKSCTASGGRSLKFCNCEQFRPEQVDLTSTIQSNSIQEEMSMGKSKKKRTKKSKAVEKKPKGEGRKPVLVGLIENPLPLYASYKGKEYTAMALTSGVIEMDEVEYPTPSAAAKAILGNNEKGKPLQVDGWHFWKFNKDGERVSLSELRDPRDIRKRPDLRKEAAA
jgi:Restriction Enzyme Adenine Methylase Associated